MEFGGWNADCAKVGRTDHCTVNVHRSAGSHISVPGGSDNEVGRRVSGTCNSVSHRLGQSGVCVIHCRDPSFDSISKTASDARWFCCTVGVLFCRSCCNLCLTLDDCGRNHVIHQVEGNAMLIRWSNMQHYKCLPERVATIHRLLEMPEYKCI